LIYRDFYFSLSLSINPNDLKRLLAIAFIVILVLNVMGFYGIFLGMQYRNDQAMVKVLDADQYDDSEAITLKIPLVLPYMTDDADFKRVDGKFQHEGEHYRLVKQKFAKDTLTVVCVLDHENKKISQALSNYVKTFSDEGASKNANSETTVSFIKDFLPQTFGLSTVTSGWQLDVIRYGLDSHLIPTFICSVIHPPERS
jgi:hypothetical protein